MSVTIDPVTSATAPLYNDQISPSNSLRPFSNLGLNETQRSQIRALTGNIDQQNDPNRYNAQVRSVLTPEQTSQFDGTFATSQSAANTNVATTATNNRSINVDARQNIGTVQPQTPLQNVSYAPRTATEYYQALARSQNPNNTATENSAQQISSLLGVQASTTPPTSAAVQQTAADTLNRQQTQRELQNFGTSGGVLNGFNVLTAFPVAIAQSTYAQANTAVSPVGRINGTQNQTIQARV